MKKLLLIATLSTVLTACTSGYHSDIASLNAERNAVQATVTSASLDQARMQRQNQLEETILRRQQDAMANQSRREQTSIVTDVLGVIFK